MGEWGRWVAGGLLLLVACGDDDGGVVMDGSTPSDAGLDMGPSCTELLWDADSGELTRWPEPMILADDPATGTGFRLEVSERWAPTFEGVGGYQPVFLEDLPTLDGFGNNAQAFFQFGRHFDQDALPSGVATGRPAAGLGMVVLGETPRLQPVLVETTDEGSTLMMAPMQPLPEQGWAAAFVTRDLTAAARGCLEPSPSMAALTSAPGPRDAEAIAALTDLGVIADPSDLVALTTFPVQTLTEDSRAIAADIAGRVPTPIDAPVCVDEASWRRCEGSFEAIDYRGADAVIVRDPGDPLDTSVTYRLPYTVWLPLGASGEPLPTIVWGSGLGSGREQGSALASFAVPEGYAVIAIDPVQHGEHPAIPEGESSEALATVLRFFTLGIDLPERALAPLQLRDHWRQSTYDKLQLVEHIRAGIDLDDDGAADLDADRLTYLGVSLGGIMGVEPLALTDAFGAAVLVVPGGRVSAIIADSSRFAPLITLATPRGVTDGQVRRFFPVLQTLLERGDAATYAPHVLEARFEATEPPSVLAGIVLDDDTVPNPANYALMRAMGLPLVAELLRPEPGFDTALEAPLAGNRLDGARTAGFLQFDLIREDGVVEAATHDNVGRSEVGVEAWLAFLEGHYADGLAVIVDPYERTGLAHGPPPEE